MNCAGAARELTYGHELYLRYVNCPAGHKGSIQFTAMPFHAAKRQIMTAQPSIHNHSYHFEVFFYEKKSIIHSSGGNVCVTDV